jgi:hypothetical protein
VVSSGSRPGAVDRDRLLSASTNFSTHRALLAAAGRAR